MNSVWVEMQATPIQWPKLFFDSVDLYEEDVASLDSGQLVLTNVIAFYMAYNTATRPLQIKSESTRRGRLFLDPSVASLNVQHPRLILSQMCSSRRAGGAIVTHAAGRELAPRNNNSMEALS